jgi:hypothetical protein
MGATIIQLSSSRRGNITRGVIIGADPCSSRHLKLGSSIPPLVVAFLGVGYSDSNQKNKRSMAAADESLAAVGARIRRKFESVEQPDKEGATLWHEYQRFQLSASSIGLYRRGHSSLDYCLRDSPLLFEYTVGLLHNLEDRLSNYPEDRPDNKT